MRANCARYRLPLVLAAIGVLANSPAFAAEGQNIYVREGCQVCHGGMGRGGVGPAFVRDPFLGFKDYVVARILLGGGEMPGFSDQLSGPEISAVATYIRNTWGNQFGPVQPDDVSQAHQKVTLHPPQNRPHLPPVPPEDGAKQP